MPRELRGRRVRVGHAAAARVPRERRLEHLLALRHLSFYKDRCPVNSVAWTPEGRRLLAGGQNGMFTLWSGVNFSFETTQQAHEAAIRCMVYSHTGEWMVSADADGVIKYWAPSLHNVKEITEAHPQSGVREVSFCPTDLKFCSCADDATVKIWDFERGALDRLLIATTPSRRATASRTDGM